MTDTFEKVLLKSPDLLNDLIKNNIISMEQAVQEVLDTKDAILICCFAWGVKGLSNEIIEKLVQSLIELQEFDKVINLAIRMQETTTNMTEKEILGRRIVNVITNSKNKELIVKFNKRLTNLKSELKEQCSALNIEFSEEPVDYSALSDEQLQEELIYLYKANVRKNKEYFNRILLDNNPG